ncbi:ribosome biogenesis protein ytm1 [Cladophialophora psammophila CBS 110553]|uniref:Ribosome biogenesis protein YTM1 n=1 Tax=Cladophialophora psammophila CBS 110553 TaxID=1182543 RepID=W9X074_9EURO|nr:ribosome biogenesis protein ytm1 [Cladophialophora psammophila CBS 110553]EXJ70735.1 ribosome biogenesis protein ytm1 [Cladophialophora psammophila CBS 110553]
MAALSGSDGDGAAGSQTQVRVRLTTRDTELAVEDIAPILVPTSFRRLALSTLVNSLLETEKTIPLEFVINGTYLRTTLDEYLTSNGISAETTLSIEYVRARIPPQYVASFEHDDWVGDVDVLSTTSPRILTASYDGLLRVWNSSSQILATSPGMAQGGHGSFIKSAKFVSPTQVVSGGFDRTLRLWKYSDQEGFAANLSPQIELYGHKSSVESVCPHGASSRILSASSDHSVGIWSSRKSDAPAAPEALVPKTRTKDPKRRKLNSEVSVSQRGPLALMQQHTGPVSGAMFDLNDPTVGYSTSWDQTVRTWDLVTASPVDTRTTSSALLCIEHMPSLHLIAAGSVSRVVKLVDPRTSAATVTAITLKGHKNSVVSLARDPTNDYTIVSGSHDGTCRVWDVRSTKQEKEGAVGQSLYTLSRASLNGVASPAVGDGVKVFAVCWHSQIGILSAGEDKAVQINRSDDQT